MTEASRRLFASSAFVVPIALAGCSLASVGTPAGNATALKIVSYVQAATTALKSVMAMFGSMLSGSVQGAVADAISAVDAAAASVGQSLANGSSDVASNTQKVVAALQIAVDALSSALAMIPTAGAALSIVREVAALIPAISALVAMLTSPAPAPAPTARVGSAAARLGVMVR